MICAGDCRDARTRAQGDSGGPLMVEGADGQFIQMGIVSWGVGCAFPTQYGVYSRTADTTLRTWIDEKLPRRPRRRRATAERAAPAAAAERRAAVPVSSSRRPRRRRATSPRSSRARSSRTGACGSAAA